MRMNMYGQYFLYALLKDHSNYSLCGKYSLEACVWGCVCACYGWPDMPSILPQYDHFDGCRSKKWMLIEIICYKLSLSRIIRVLKKIFSVLIIFLEKYSSDTQCSWPYWQALCVVNQGTKVQEFVSNTLPYQSMYRAQFYCISMQLLKALIISQTIIEF